MKRVLLIASVVLAAFALSCTKTKVEDAVTLKTSSATVSVDGDVVSIALNSSVAWTAKSDQSWVTLSPASGEAGDATIKASVVKNETTDDRTAEVTVTAGTKSAKFTITQSQKDAMEVKAVDFVVPAEGGTVEIPVSANVNYSVIVPDGVDWITVTKGMVDSKVVLEVAETHGYVQNEETWEIEEDAILRTAKVTIAAGSITHEVEVSQKAFVPYFEYEGDWAGIQWSFYDGVATMIPQEGAEIVIDINTNIEWRTYFSVWDNEQAAMVDTWDLGWATLEYDETHIYLNVAPNDTYFARENYLYSVGIIDGAEDGNFGGLGWFVQEGKPLDGVNYEFAWSTMLNSAIVPGYNRLAYKTAGGDALLISDGTSVHAISPADGTYWKAINWATVTPTSICSDDAGNVIVADHSSAAAGATYSVYYAQNVNEEPIKLFDHANDFDGIEIGGWRVRGDIDNGAMITAIVTMYEGNPSYWAGWEIMNKEVAYNNYYVEGTLGQNRGPLAITLGSPVYGAVMSLGANTNDGIVARGYDGDNRDLFYLASATYPNWVTPYDWQSISVGGNGGNENQNNMAIAEYNGKRILAYTQGFHFPYSSDATISIFDATDMTNFQTLAIIDPMQDIAEIGEFNWTNGADILLHPTDECLELYAVNSGRSVLCKYKIVF